ncbi:MAG: hypothetical protein KC897_11225 [Candidatus Omnitrophica bacterium]|nr:hypothetical protein [Candidatus Omnitrophota bacterium]
MEQRIRIEIYDLRVKTPPGTRWPLDAWRVTLFMSGAPSATTGPFFNNVDFHDILAVNSTSTQVNNAVIQLGGAYDEHGRPVYIKENLWTKGPGNGCNAIMILERFEKIDEP